MFSQEESSAISDSYTAVKLLGGSDLDDEGKAFMKRYGVGGYPTLLAMTADGSVIGRSFDRTLDGILNGMEAAGLANEDFKVKKAELSKKTDAESIRALAGLYRERADYANSRSGYEKLTAKDPTVEDQEALLGVLENLDDAAARKALLATLVKTRADHEKHIYWRMDLATADLPTSITSREEYREVAAKRQVAFTALLAEVKKVEEQAVLRNALARMLNNTGDPAGAMAHWDWILDNARDTKVAAGVLWNKSNLLIRQGQFEKDVEKVKEAKALWQELVEKHASAKPGQQAARFMPQLEGLITKMLEDAAKPADDEKEEGGDEKKEGGDGGG